MLRLTTLSGILEAIEIVFVIPITKEPLFVGICVQSFHPGGNDAHLG